MEAGRNQSVLNQLIAKVDDILITCALRFNGYKYLDENNPGMFDPVDVFFRTGSWDISNEEKLTAFFFLQRGLYKWDLVYEPFEGKYHRAFRSLFFEVYALRIAKKYRHQEYYDQWFWTYLPHLSKYINLVRLLHDSINYNDHAEPLSEESLEGYIIPEKWEEIKDWDQIINEGCNVTFYGVNKLKSETRMTESTVECPVIGCDERVVRQRKKFQAKPEFQCPRHMIFISPSTFEYQSMFDNLLWKDENDLALLNGIMYVKRESRMARDNSEDALTWNVFRFLEKTKLLSEFLSDRIGFPGNIVDLVYWSYSKRASNVSPNLDKARYEFGEYPKQGSEPDFIVIGDQIVYWIEAKFTATNNTKPSKPEEMKRYLTGGHGWFSSVFNSNYENICIEQRKYELMRFWLLGSWMAKQLGRKFCLVNLTLTEREKEIEERFKPHIIENDRRVFMRITWEGIYEFIKHSAPSSHETETLRAYLKNKTIGYDHHGKLQMALSLQGL